MPGPRFPSEYGLVRPWCVVWFCWYYSIFFIGFRFCFLYIVLLTIIFILGLLYW